MGQMEDDDEDDGMDAGNDQGTALGRQSEQNVGSQKEKEQARINRNDPVHVVYIGPTKKVRVPL